MAANGNHEEKLSPAESNDLSRQMTMSLSPDQYERLFFQPTQAKGDLAKRLGNPTLLGLMGFLIPYTTTMFCLMQFRGSSSASLTAISSCYFFLGGIAMNIAGICEFVLGNSFPMAVFIIYGSHWCKLGFDSDPIQGIVASYGADGAVNQAYNNGQGNYNVIMAMISFVFMIGSLRTNLPFVLTFFSLVFLFSFIAASFYTVGYSAGANADYAAYLLLIGGGFGFVAAICGWYLAIITACAATGVPCPLPIFDLSTKVFAHNSAQKGEHVGVVRRGSIQE